MLLQKLEVVNLVRLRPATGEGRAVHVGRAFLGKLVTFLSKHLKISTLYLNKS
jgi:hypothetical protein